MLRLSVRSRPASRRLKSSGTPRAGMLNSRRIIAPAPSGEDLCCRCRESRRQPHGNAKFVRIWMDENSDDIPIEPEGGEDIRSGVGVGEPATDIGSEETLLEALRSGDEDAFAAIVDSHHGSMIRIARLYVADDATAEEVAQEAWLAVLKGIDRFEGRSALRTWIFRIVSNLAKTRGVRERRSVPFSVLIGDDIDGVDGMAPEDRFFPPDDPDRAGRWITYPEGWGDQEERMLSAEAREVAEAAIQALPPRQRIVITLRDVEGMDSDYVRNELDISATNQRVLLHRARTTVRAELERYFAGEG